MDTTQIQARIGQLEQELAGLRAQLSAKAEPISVSTPATAALSSVGSAPLTTTSTPYSAPVNTAVSNNTPAPANNSVSSFVGGWANAFQQQLASNSAFGSALTRAMLFSDKRLKRNIRKVK